jgi:hypothetical protein
MVRDPGGRSELDPSGVLFLLEAMWLADIVKLAMWSTRGTCEAEIGILEKAGQRPRGVC